MKNGNIVRVRVVRGQYMITIPKALAQGLRLRQGDKVEVYVEGPGVLKLRVLYQEDEDEGWGEP